MILGKIMVISILLVSQSDSRIRLGTECLLIPSFVYDHKYVEFSIGPETRVSLQPIRIKKARPYLSVGAGVLEWLWIKLMSIKTNEDYSDHTYAFTTSLGIKYDFKKKFGIKLGLTLMIGRSTWEYSYRDTEYEWFIIPIPDIGFRFFFSPF